MENGGDLPQASTPTSNTTNSGTADNSNTANNANSSPGQSPTRKKRSVSETETEAKSEVQSDGASEKSLSKSSTKKDKSKNGCPKDFERLSDYLCLHFHKDAAGDGIQSSFESSQKYCTEKDSSASLLQFVNEKEATKIWKWLGNICNFYGKKYHNF